MERKAGSAKRAQVLELSVVRVAVQDYFLDQVIQERLMDREFPFHFASKVNLMRNWPIETRMIHQMREVRLKLFYILD